MSENSKIEWTDHTFNPWIGCTRVSPGCDHCYAAVSTPARVMGVKWGTGEARQRTSASTWKLPRRWIAKHEAFFAEHGRRQRVFCASLADVFDNAVDPQWRADLFRLIDDTPNLDWLLLTKRVGNVEAMIQDVSDRLFGSDALRPAVLPDNVWLGATIVNQEEADRDIPKLLSVPARIRFLSMEPLLGPINLTRLAHGDESDLDALRGQLVFTPQHIAMPPQPLPSKIDWVIVGGESGAGARPTHPDWARSLRDQCAAAAVPFLFKQHGEYVVPEDGAESCRVCGCTWNNACSGGCYWAEPGLCSSCIDCEPAPGDRAVKFARVGKRAAGRELDGVTHDGFPETR
jgi:protein gp37